MSSTRRSVLGTATTAGTILTAGYLALLDVEGEEPHYISVSNRHEDLVTIDLTITDIVTGEIVYNEELNFDGFAGADEDGSPPRKQPDLGIGEGFKATVTAVTDQDSVELTDDIAPSAGSWINITHGSDAELSISRDVV